MEDRLRMGDPARVAYYLRVHWLKSFVTIACTRVTVIPTALSSIRLARNRVDCRVELRLRRPPRQGRYARDRLLLHGGERKPAVSRARYVSVVPLNWVRGRWTRKTAQPVGAFKSPSKSALGIWTNGPVRREGGRGAVGRTENSEREEGER